MRKKLPEASRYLPLLDDCAALVDKLIAAIASNAMKMGKRFSSQELRYVCEEKIRRDHST